MKRELQQLIDFVAFTHKIRNVKRSMLLETNQRNENDMEHCYQLALVGWFLIENDNLDLDKYKVVCLAIVHDIPEVYAGDLIAFASDKEKSLKSKKEQAAIKKLKIKWPSFTSLHELINEYEDRKTSESKFVYALDKLLPMVNNYQYKGRAWKKHQIRLDDVKAVKDGKISLSDPINKYYKSIIELLETKPELFEDTK